MKFAKAGAHGGLKMGSSVQKKGKKWARDKISDSQFEENDPNRSQLVTGSAEHRNMIFYVMYLQNPQKNLVALQQFLIPFDIFNFNYEATIEYGIIRSDLERRGTPIGPLDTLIAAHAKSLNCTLETNNEREFRRIGGLHVENWV